MRRDVVLRLEAIERAKAHLWTSPSPKLVDPVVRASWQRCAPVLDTARDHAPVDPTDDIDATDLTEQPLERSTR